MHNEIMRRYMELLCDPHYAESKRRREMESEMDTEYWVDFKLEGGGIIRVKVEADNDDDAKVAGAEMLQELIKNQGTGWYASVDAEDVFGAPKTEF